MTTENVPFVSFTDAAVEKLTEIVSSYPEPVAGVRIKIAGRNAGGFDHVVTLVEVGVEPADDVVVEVGGLRVFVEGQNADRIRGTSIDYEYKGPNISGLEFNNPNSVWSNDVELEIARIIDEYINPQIASHGGFITLLEYNEGRVIVEMGGGCQGCGMASVTLKQGVEVALKQAIPEVKEVLDTTDHAAGTNPYFQPAKEGAAAK